MIQLNDRKMIVLARRLSLTLLFTLSIASKEAAAERPPFDLTYVMPEAMGVIAIRPHAIFHDPAMKPLASMANNGLKQLRQFLNLSADSSLPIEEIEEIMVYVNKVTSKSSVKNERSTSTFGFTGGLVMLRATHDFDWRKMLWRLDPKTEEICCEAHTYYRSHHPKWCAGISPKATFCSYLPDQRTIVFLHEKILPTFLKGRVKQRPHFSWEKDWQRVEHDLIAVALDKRWADGIREQVSEDYVSLIIPSLLRDAPRIVAGVDWADGIDFRAYLACKDASVAKRWRQSVRDLIGMLRFAWEPAMECQAVENEQRSQKVESASLPPEIKSQLRVWHHVMKHCHVTRRETTVCVHTSAKLNIADAVKAFLFETEAQKKP